VSDVVSAVLSALRYQGDESTFMIGPSHCTTIAEVARLIRAHPQVQIDEIVFDASKPTGDIGRFADSRLALGELGWSPKIELRAGVHDLIDRIINDGR
jgi:nucleoside-diphosphate-sugar epimerase